jgi:hypothetical protein
MKFKAPAPKSGSSEGGSLYVRLKDGESIKFTPRGEIYEFYSVFGTRGEVSPDTPGAKLKYKVNVIINDNGTLVAKIYEFGMTVYEQLYHMSMVCDVTKTKFQLSRRGSTKENTQYTLIPVINEPLGPQVLAAFDKITLNILDRNKPTESKLRSAPDQLPPDFDTEIQPDEELPF